MHRLLILAQRYIFSKRPPGIRHVSTYGAYAVLGLLFLSGCSILDSTASRNPAPYATPPVTQDLRTVSPAARILPPAVTPKPGQLTHVVAPKETLWRIGQLYGIPHEEIMRLNRLTDPHKLSAGMTLVIPGNKPNLDNIPLPANQRWTHIVIHHSATDYGNATILDRSHRKRGFKNGLGYHFVIDNGTSHRKDGQIEVGPRWKTQRKGAHCNAGGMNSHGIGICLVGNFTGKPISRGQMDALVYLVDRLRRRYDIPMSRVIRHGDVKGKITACPGDRFPWSSFKNRLAIISSSRAQQFAHH